MGWESYLAESYSEFESAISVSPAGRLIHDGIKWDGVISRENALHHPVSYGFFMMGLLPRLDRLFERFGVGKSTTAEFDNRLRDKWPISQSGVLSGDVRNKHSNRLMAALAELILAEHVEDALGGRVIDLEAWSGAKTPDILAEFGTYAAVEVKYLGYPPEESGLADRTIIDNMPKVSSVSNDSMRLSYFNSRIVEATDQLAKHPDAAKIVALVFDDRNSRGREILEDALSELDISGADELWVAEIGNLQIGYFRKYSLINI